MKAAGVTDGRLSRSGTALPSVRWHILAECETGVGRRSFFEGEEPWISSPRQNGVPSVEFKQITAVGFVCG